MVIPGEEIEGAARSKAPAHGRGEPLVHGILSATMAELGRVGFGLLRVEDVAARAGVNKTTIYRRWPTKQELVQAALLHMRGEQLAPPATGSLRGDLLALLHHMRQVSCSTEGQGLFRMLLAEGPSPEVMDILAFIRHHFDEVPRAILKAAAARGEIAPDPDPMLLFDALAGAVHRRLFLDRTTVDDTFLERLVDLLLLGALTPAARGAPAPRPEAAPAAQKAAAPKRRTAARRR